MFQAYKELQQNKMNYKVRKGLNGYFSEETFPYGK